MTAGARSLDGVGRIAGRQRDDIGPDLYDLECTVCKAGWVGKEGDCAWCAAELERLRADQRRMLLWPDWLAVDHGPRYDELSAVDKAVWDRTRGQVPGHDSIPAWVERLARAVKADLITEDEARGAIERTRAA